MGCKSKTISNRVEIFTCLKPHAYKISLFILILKLGSSRGQRKFKRPDRGWWNYVTMLIIKTILVSSFQYNLGKLCKVSTNMTCLSNLPE